MLSINVVSIIWVIVNLIVVYVFFRKLFYKRVKAVMDKRKQLLNSQFEDAKKKNLEADKRKEQYEASLQGAHDESMRIIEDAKVRGENLYQKKIREAEAASGDILRKANETIAAEREKARRDAQAEITGLAMAAAAKIISSASNQETDSDLYNQFLTKAGDTHDANSK